MPNLFRSASLPAAMLVAVAVGLPEAGAQTPTQLEYDRQQREYRQQQEQQQRLQQLMNENARRQQEESRRLNAPAGQSPVPSQSPTPPTGSGQKGGQAFEDARQTWLKRPPLPADHNPLLGRWKRPPTVQANSSDPFAALQALAKGGLCEVLFGGGTFEFRPTSLVGFDERTSAQELDRVEYRGGGKQVVVLPKTTVRIMVFDFDGPDRISWAGQNCVLVRAGPASQAPALASSANPRPAAPAAPGTTTVTRAAGGGAGSVASRGAALSLVAGLLYPSGKYFPMAGTTFYILNEDLDTALARGGVQAPPGGSPLRAWIMSCEAQQAAVCSQGNRVFEASTVATLRTDLQGQAELGTLSAGTYYVYGGNQRYRQRAVLWNVRVDVREGANSSVKLDQGNVTAVN